MNAKLYKVLSRNDTGETHSHQSGISIPQKIAKIGIFPTLTKDVLNPRVDLTFFDEEGIAWTFQYIYYNDRYFGKPPEKSHDEFRLTCVKGFIDKYHVKSGNEIWFSINDKGIRKIGYCEIDKEEKIDNKAEVLRLSANWHVVNY